MVDHTHADSPTIAARLHRRLRSFEPLYLALLGLLAVPSYVFESLAVLEIFELFFLFFLWPFVAPLVELVVRRGTDEDETAEPTDWLRMGGWREYAVWLLTVPLLFLNPLVLAQDVMQWFGSAVAFARHRGSLPDAKGYDQQVSYRLPIDGAWTVVNGSYDRDYSHSWLPLTQRYAYDFVVTDDDGRTRPEGATAAVENYYCHEEPVLAPADGVVVDVLDDDLEPSRGGGFSHPLKRDIRGNYVVIQHAADEYSCLAHLVPGSVTVAPGDRVARGQPVGRCGHSGNSSEPHLHFQLQDHPNFAVATGLPVAFDDVAIEWPGEEAPIDDPPSVVAADRADASTDLEPFADLADGTRHSRVHLTAGQRVAHVDRDDGGSGPDREVAPGTALVDDDAGATGDAKRRPAGVATLQRIGYGACVGGVATFLGPVLLPPLTVAALLGAAASLAAVSRIGARLLRRADSGWRPESLGTAVGVGAVAAVVAWHGWSGPAVGVGAQGLGLSALLIGFVGYAALGEYDRRRLRESFLDRTPALPSSPIE